ncbi:hypothetical protein LP416_11340 [Polaromonas sp. P2-4]|nr:hypothetical protein LP416_11340 [Polaromonas sp. P2-4]
MTAFLPPCQCPGTAIRTAMDWALEQARAKAVVVSGFHSPLEQSVLNVLIQARSPVVAVLARPAQGAKLPPEWAEPLVQGHLTVMSVATAATRSTRLTGEVATARNNLVVQLATGIVVANASPGVSQFVGPMAVGRATAYQCFGVTNRKSHRQVLRPFLAVDEPGDSLSLGLDNETEKTGKSF